MTPADYIISQLNNLRNQKEILVDVNDINGFISKTVLSKKFRKYSVDDDFKQHLDRVITECVSKNLPIPFVWDFGGYKLWRLSESPKVDWAELFTLIYFAQWLLPIALAYKPGVYFDFYSEDIFVPQINNVSCKDTAAYIASFKKLLKFIKKYLPDNFSFKLTRLIDQYSNQKQFDEEFRQNLVCLKKELPGGLPKLTPEEAATVELNVKLDEKQALDPLWREKVRLIHDAYSMASKRRPYYRNESKILVNNVRTKCAIATGTAKTSVVKFWVGAGVLGHHRDIFIEHILTPHQIEMTSFEFQPICITGLDEKNFQQIKVIK